MKIALLADPLWLMRESSTLRRLVVGLLDENVRVVRVIPQAAAAEQEDLAVTSGQVTYPGSRRRWLRDFQIMRLADSLRALDVDIVHALDASLQRVALKLGAALDVPVVTSVWSSEEIPFIRGHTAVPCACAAATPALLDLSLQRMGAAGVCELVAPGVYPRESPDDIRAPLSDAAESISMLVVGNGRLDRHYEALLHAMARVKNQLAHAFYFFYTVTGDQHELWRLAERLKLLDQVSMAPSELSSRELLIQADVVLQPQPLGAARSLILESLAAGRPLIASADPMVDYVREGQTAFIVESPSVDKWSHYLTQLGADPEPFLQLGRSARDYIRTHHSPATFIGETLKLYRKLAPEPLPFKA